MSQELVRPSRPKQQSQMGSMVFGYLSQSNSMEYFDESIKRFQEEGKIPDLENDAEYTIYKWKAGFFNHISVVLGSQGKFFTIEIRVIDAKLCLYTTAEKINVSKLKECGKTVRTGLELINKAWKVYNNMDKYNFATNNCQDFVNKYLEEIEMHDKTESTDFQSLVSMAAIGALAYFGYSWLNSKRKQ